jgi:hypothetical protein
VRPPSSPCKPHVSDTTPNRLFLRGFSATQFPDFGLCRRSRILVAGFGALSPHLKIPFPAVGLEREVRPRFAPVIRDRGRPLQLFRIESERRKLPAPFGRRIAEPLDADAAGQATFYRCFDKIGRVSPGSQSYAPAITHVYIGTPRERTNYHVEAVPIQSFNCSRSATRRAISADASSGIGKTELTLISPST